MSNAERHAAGAARLQPAGLPKARGGHYAPGVRAGDMVFVSGQLPVASDGSGIVAGDIGAQTEQALDNVAAVLAEAGAELADLVKVTVYLADQGDWEGMNAAYSRRLGDATPARAAIGGVTLPLGARVEIDATAVRGSRAATR